MVATEFSSPSPPLPSLYFPSHSFPPHPLISSWLDGEKGWGGGEGARGGTRKFLDLTEDVDHRHLLFDDKFLNATFPLPPLEGQYGRGEREFYHWREETGTTCIDKHIYKYILGTVNITLPNILEICNCCDFFHVKSVYHNYDDLI